MRPRCGPLRRLVAVGVDGSLFNEAKRILPRVLGIEGALAPGAVSYTHLDVYKRQLRAAESWLAEHPHADLFVFNDLHSEFPVGEVYAARANGME